ncbi:MAG: hypothetical protein LBI48_04320 [Burkholderiaceae bacterium]|jgi:Tfp pilus assembly protein PilX|nr:hypothetical protein [Burkholderiaceae bacterium]
MNTILTRHLPPLRGPRMQRGISMFIVMVILLLAMILVLGGISVANLNESLVGNQSDAQRAYGAAQALMDTAQRDIRLNGRNCNAVTFGAMGTNGDFQVMSGTTSVAAQCFLRFPRDIDDYMTLVTSGNIPQSACATNAVANGNLVGVCIPVGPTDAMFRGDRFNNGDLNTNAQQWDNANLRNGALYAQFVGALDATGAVDNNGNPVGRSYGSNAQLGTTGTALTTAMSNGGYWVEIFPYNVNQVGADTLGNAPVPDEAYSFVFRITVIARGLKGGTVSVLRSYYTPAPMRAAPT